MYERKIHDIDDLQKRLMQTWFNSDQDITAWRCDWPVAWPSEIMCACWWCTLWTHVQLYDSPKCFLWNCQCKLMHLRAIL